MENRRIILIIVVIILGFAIYQGLFKKEKSNFILEKVSRGNISQEVLETGTIKVSEEINLGFESIGRIEKIYVNVGDEVELGENLIKLDTNQLDIQFIEAKAALEVDQAKLNKLLAGSIPEEIKIAETAVLNAQNNLESVSQNLKDIKTQAEEDLNAAYEDALNILDDSYLKAYNSLNDVDLIQRTYFTGNDQESFIIQENKTKINNNLNQAKNYLDIAKQDLKDEDIDTVLNEFKNSLSNIYDSLSIIRETTETPNYQDKVSSANKTSLDTHKKNINTVFANIINSQQTISSIKLSNETDINTAEAEVLGADGILRTAEDELSLVKTEPRQVDINVYQAQIKQAQAKVSLLENQIQKATLKSPVKGQITEIEKRAGEMIQIGESVISLIPKSPFQVEVDIYEEDIIKIKVNNPVDIIIAAFPDEILKGQVLSINPAEKLIEGIVYYEVNIDFKEQKQGIKPGMTADIVIQTVFKNNVLVIPKDAIEKKNNKFITQVLKDGQIQSREIEIGLKGSDGMVEVIFGLKEGEEVILK